jgi:hypothetical protein
MDIHFVSQTRLDVSKEVCKFLLLVP